MNKIPNTRIRLSPFLVTAAILLAGCAGTSNPTTDQVSSVAGDTGGTYSSEDTGDTSAAQADTETLPSGDGDSAPTDPGWQYIWQEITVTLPAEWKDRCVIQENANGFSIFQKASYEENEDGFLCSFTRSSEYYNYGAGETLLAYTNDGQLYYMMQPTDFACASEKRETLGEYARMCLQVEDLADSLEIANSDGVHYDAWEYVLPVSSILPLAPEHLMNLSDNALWIARNEIYARHGRMFTNEYLQLRFDSCTWYQGTVSPEQFDESVLSQTERDNIQLLIAAEQEYDERHPYPKQYQASETVVETLSGNGGPNKITYLTTADDSHYSELELVIDGKSYDLDDLQEIGCYIDYPNTKLFYITDIMEDDGFLEIAILDLGPSIDLVTHFFRYDGTLFYIGTVGGWPFAEVNSGVNGFHGYGWITGKTRSDLIETIYPEGSWHYDYTQDQIVYQETTWHSYFFMEAHTLYEDLPVHSKPDPSSETLFIPADTEIHFLSTDLEQWILVKGKNGDMGYMQVADEKIIDLDKPANEVISNLDFYD